MSEAANHSENAPDSIPPKLRDGGQLFDGHDASINIMRRFCNR